MSDSRASAQSQPCLLACLTVGTTCVHPVGVRARKRSTAPARALSSHLKEPQAPTLAAFAASAPGQHRATRRAGAAPAAAAAIADHSAQRTAPPRPPRTVQARWGMLVHGSEAWGRGGGSAGAALLAVAAARRSRSDLSAGAAPSLPRCAVTPELSCCGVWRGAHVVVHAQATATAAASAQHGAAWGRQQLCLGGWRARRCRRRLVSTGGCR